METLQIKVIIRDGLAEAVLVNQDIPVEVEIIDIDKDYRDAKALDEYADSFYKDPSFKQCDYTTANFEGSCNDEEDAEEDEEE